MSRVFSLSLRGFFLFPLSCGLGVVYKVEDTRRLSMLLNRRDNLRGVADGLEEIPERAAAGQVNADATSGFGDARPILNS